MKQRLVNTWKLITLYLLCLFLSGCDTVKPSPFDFKTLERPDKPNSYLVCPKNYCKTRISETAPIFNTNVNQLQTALKKVIAEQPRTKLLTEDNHHQQYVQRSLIFRFPDIIDIQLIPLNPKQSTLAIYSRSVYGYYDFNVNKTRVKKWLNDLKSITAT